MGEEADGGELKGFSLSIQYVVSTYGYVYMNFIIYVHI